MIPMPIELILTIVQYSFRPGFVEILKILLEFNQNLRNPVIRAVGESFDTDIPIQVY